MFAIVVFVLAGCGSPLGTGGGGKGGQGAAKVTSDPVTLNAAIEGISVPEEFASLLADSVKKKYPNITLNIIQPVGQGTSLASMVAAGQAPDIVFTFNGRVKGLQEMDLLYDMTPLLKEHNVDVGRFEPNYIRDAKIASEKDELYGVPYNVNFHAMYYNKDIFDKFGAPYPKDGMTWEQLLDLARKVARKDGNTQYRGLDPGNSIIWMSQPLSIAAIDPNTDKATVNTDLWKKVFELAKSIYMIPGNEYIPVPAKDQFMKNKTLAVLLDLNIFNQLETATKEGLNWDMAQYPSYPEKPNTYGNASVNVMMITKSSKYKHEAMEAIKIAVSDEVQTAMSRLALLSPLKSEAVKKAFGESRDFLKNKHVEGIFKSKPVPYPVASQYRSKAENILIQKFNEFRDGKIDVNTALSRAEEEINQMVATEKGK
jgi:multiple sugar transport system substrate-binding protein